MDGLLDVHDRPLIVYSAQYVAQWIRPRTLNGEVPNSNLLAAAVVPLGKALYPQCLVPRKGLPLVACL